MATNAKKAEREALDPIVAALFEDHLRPIFAYLTRLLGDQDLAEEVAHEAILAAQRASDQLPSIVDRRAWLYGIASDNAFRALRRLHVGLPSLRRAKEQPFTADGYPGELARNEAVERALLLALAPEHRAPLLLYSHHRLSLVEVAQALHAGEDATKAALFHARVLFERAYEPSAKDAGHGGVKEQLAVYDSLNREQQAELDRHLFACAECAAELAAYRRMDRALRKLPDARPSDRLQTEVAAWVNRAQRRETPEPAARPKSSFLPLPPSPPPPVAGTEPVRDDPPDSSPSLRWRRMVLPVAMALLFAGSLWAGMRGNEPTRNRTDKVPTPPVTIDTVQNRVLPIAPTEAPPVIDVTGRVTITFACDDVAPYAKLVQAFESENPDIIVQLRSATQVVSLRPSQSTSLSSRSSLDAGVALAPTDAFCTSDDPALFLDGIVRNLGPLAKADDSFSIEEFYPEVLQQATIAGSLYMIPARFRPVLLRFDPAAFQAARLQPPHPGWSWDDLLSSAAALTQRYGATTRRWGFGESDDQFLLARFFSATTSPLAADSLGRDDPFANPEVRRLFEWFDELYFKERAGPVPRASTKAEASVTSSDPAQAASVRSAMWTDESPSVQTRGMRAAPFPVARAFDKTTPIGKMTGWAISSEGSHVDAAWRWISFISQNLPAGAQGLEVPARRSVPEMQAFWKEVPPADRDAYEYGLEHLSAWPDMTHVPGMLPLYTRLESMIHGEMSLAALTSRDNTPESKPVEPSNVITVTFAAPRDDKPDYEQAAAAFTQANSGIQIRIVAVEDLMAGRQGNEVLWNQMRVMAGRVDAFVSPEVPALVRSGRAGGILHDLTDLIPESLKSEDYYPNTLEALQWRGRNLAIPGRLGLLLIHYSHFMFEQMGVAYPQPGWTWGDFDRTVRAVGLHGGSNSRWWGFKERSGSRLQLLTIRSGPLVDYSINPTLPLLDQPAALQAASWYAGLLKDGLVAPEDRSADDAAMWIGLTDPSVLDAVYSTGVGVAPLPVDPGSAATTPLELYDAFAVSARTPHPNEAWKWLVYLQTHPPVKPRHHGGIPARRANVVASDLPKDADLREVFEYALEHTEAPAPLRPEEYLVTQQLAAALNRIVKDGQEPPAAVKQAQTGAQKDLELN